MRKRNLNTTASSVAVVILNWNGRSFLEQFLPSVITHSGNADIIVADNASTDDSISFISNAYPQIRVIRNNSNEGFAKGYNTALKQVRADYYVLLNSDVEVSAGWIDHVIALMKADKTIGACQPKILSFADRGHFEYAGASGGWIDSLGHSFMRGRIFDVCEKDNGQYDTVQQCFWASGAAFFVRAEVYHEMGGLDEYFFAHQEEIDLCWRMQLAGYKVMVQPASVVYHVGGGTLPKGNSRKTFLNFRNNLIMITKNSRIETCLWKIPFRIMLDIVSAFRALFRGDSGFFAAVIKADLHYMNWLLFKKPTVTPKDKRRILTAGWYKGSVAWQHFIKGKQRFSEIVKDK